MTAEQSGRRSIILAIDVEPDGRRELDKDNGWKGSRDAIEHFRRLRGSLEEATAADVRFNWFLRADPQIAGTWGTADYVAEACPELVRMMENTGDGAGVHVHAWRWSGERGRWFNDLKNDAWIDECIDTSMKAISGIFGDPVKMNRFGDRWLSESAIASLRRHGISYDLTIEPGLPDMPIHDDAESTAWLPDFRGAPRTPYHPDGNNYMKEAPGGSHDSLLMIPVTTSPMGWRLVRRAPFIMRGSRSPNLVLGHPAVTRIISDALKVPSPAPVVIVVRSGDLSNARFYKNFKRTTAALIRHPALAYCQFTTVEEAASRWKQSRHHVSQ